MCRLLPTLVLLVLITMSAAGLARAANTQPGTMPDDAYSRSENWRSVLLYGEFDGPAFDNYFNRRETLRFIVSAENGGRLHQFISLDYPEQPRRVFLGEIAVNQRNVVLTAQVIHSYLNPASSYKFPIMNAQNQQLLSFESAIKTTALPSDQVVKTVTISVTGQEGWFTDPTYQLEILEDGRTGEIPPDNERQLPESADKYN